MTGLHELAPLEQQQQFIPVLIDEDFSLHQDLGLNSDEFFYPTQLPQLTPLNLHPDDYSDMDVNGLSSDISDLMVTPPISGVNDDTQSVFESLNIDLRFESPSYPYQRGPYSAPVMLLTPEQYYTDPMQQSPHTQNSAAGFTQMTDDSMEEQVLRLTGDLTQQPEVTLLQRRRQSTTSMRQMIPTLEEEPASSKPRRYLSIYGSSACRHMDSESCVRCEIAGASKRCVSWEDDEKPKKRHSSIEKRYRRNLKQAYDSLAALVAGQYASKRRLLELAIDRIEKGDKEIERLLEEITTLKQTQVS